MIRLILRVNIRALRKEHPYRLDIVTPGGIVKRGGALGAEGAGVVAGVDHRTAG